MTFQATAWRRFNRHRLDLEVSHTMASFVVDVASDVGYSNILLGIVVSLLLMLIMRKRTGSKRLNLPPGPINIPWPLNYLTGLVRLFKNPLEIIRELHNQYGDIVYICDGDYRYAFLASYELVKDLLIKRADVTSGREELWELKAVAKCKGGIIFSSGQEWVDHRRLGLASIRNFGKGKKSLQHCIDVEARILVDAIAESIGIPFNPEVVLSKAVSNIICSITFGHRFEYSDPKFTEMTHRIKSYASQDPGILTNLPAFFMNKRRRNLLEVKKFLVEEIQEHEKNFDPNDIRDAIDRYLLEVQRAQKSGEKTEFGMEKAWTLIFDLFLGGTETSSASLLWAFVFLVGNPEIQEKVCSEIDDVVGHSRTPEYEDRTSMPYTEATIMEALRFRPIAPSGVPHRCTADMEVRGYVIPKDTNIGANILYIHNDPKLWGDPEVFRPERFLSEDGKEIVKPEAYFPFGVGRRVCIGEQLSKMEIFLFLTNILQRFKVSFPPGAVPDYSIGHRFTTLAPKPYEIIFEER
ncbi:cytochrome P450 2B2-like [Diadema antillarum]|uniref:cytochrome P450 2B2-like n=1 Tax=Diadema antillarum TaxID=105358 RepID=UPI003A87E66B